MASVHHEYGPPEARLRALDAHQAQSTARLTESPLSLQELGDALRGDLTPGHATVPIVITAGTGWTATRAAHGTGLWFERPRL